MVRNMVNLLVARGPGGRHIRGLREFTELQDRLEGRQRVEVTTAVALEPAEVERITQFVAGLIAARWWLRREWTRISSGAWSSRSATA